MIIDVARLNAEGETLAGADPAAILEWDPADELLQPSGDVSYRLRAERLLSELLVRGSVWASFTGVCTRCGGSMTLAVEDREFCVSVPVAEGIEFVDLTSDLREAILLTLPNHPICSANCRGVCPRCGKRLGKTQCKCSTKGAAEMAAPSAWEALNQLKFPTKKKKVRISDGRSKKKEI